MASLSGSLDRYLLALHKRWHLLYVVRQTCWMSEPGNDCPRWATCKEASAKKLLGFEAHSKVRVVQRWWTFRKSLAVWSLHFRFRPRSRSRRRARIPFERINTPNVNREKPLPVTEAYTASTFSTPQLSLRKHFFLFIFGRPLAASNPHRRRINQPANFFPLRQWEKCKVEGRKWNLNNG